MGRMQQGRGCTEGSMAPLAARHPLLKNTPSRVGVGPHPCPQVPGDLGGVCGQVCVRGDVRGAQLAQKPFFHPVSVWLDQSPSRQKYKQLLLGTLQGSAPRRRILPCHGCILHPPTSSPENRGVGTALRMLRCPPAGPTGPGDTHLRASSATGGGAGSGWHPWR